MSDAEALDIIRGWMERSDMAPSLRKQANLYQKLKHAQETGDQSQILNLVHIIDEGVRRLKERRQLKLAGKSTDALPQTQESSESKAVDSSPGDAGEPPMPEWTGENRQEVENEEESDWWVEDESWS